jgi:2-dehydropantoate 2-reductase
MKIAVIGAGAIGSLFGSLLKANNFDVCLYDRDIKKIEFIKKNGIELVFPKTGRKKKIFPEASSELPEIKSCDYYLFCVKSYSTEIAASEIAGIASDNSIAVTFQNGMGNVEKIQKYFPDKSIAAGTTSEGATFVPPGTVIYGGKGKTSVSMIVSASDRSRLNPLINVLNRSGLDADISSDFRKDIWRKLIINAAINPVTAVMKLQNRYISESKYLRAVSDLLIEESVKTAEAEGIYFNPDEIKSSVYSVAEKTGENRSSMLQDIENSRKTEIDFISGAIAERAENFSLKTPANIFMQNIIKVLESKHFT